MKLPPRCYQKNGAIYYVDLARKWHRLGKTWDRDAQKEYDRVARGTAPPRTVAAMLDAFLKHREALVRMGDTSARTLADNEIEAVNLRMTFGLMDADTVNSADIARYLKRRTNPKTGRHSPVRANRERALLSSAYSWAMGEEDWEIITNPCLGVKRNKERARTRYIGTSELAAWKRHATDRLRAYVLLKRLIAARQSDVLGLGLQHLSERGINYQAGKTRRPVRVRWTWALRIVIEALKKIRQQQIDTLRREAPISTALFLSRFRNQLAAGGFRTEWQRTMALYVKAGGVRFRENDIRAKSASDLPLDRAQELLDHASPAITKRVYQRAPTNVRPLR